MTQSRRLVGRWLIVAALVGCSACNRDQAPSPPPTATATSKEVQLTRVIEVPPSIEPRVKTHTISVQVMEDIVTAPGEVTLDLKRVGKVTSRIEGQVEQVFVRLGDRVTKGQPLVAISSLQLDQLVEEYLVAKAQAEVAENTFQRTERLRQQDIVPERKLVEDRGRYLEGKARYQHIREKLRNMGMTAGEIGDLDRGKHVQRHQYFLRAPLSGTVSRQEVVLGQGVTVGADLLEVVDTSHVWVFASLPIEQARRFKEGDTGTIVPKGGAPLTAPLTYLAPVADEKTRTIRVRFDADNATGRLKPNEYVDVQVPVAGGIPVLAVPQTAVTTVNKQRGVFVRKPKGYVFAPIETGREEGGLVEVRQGLVAGEVVASEGVFDLKNLLLKDTMEGGA